MAGPVVNSVPPEARDGDLVVVRRIVLDGLRGYSARIFLFGSRACAEARPRSDIDVAVLPLVPFPPGLLSEIREDLEESQVLAPVDLVDLSDVSDQFRARVMAEGVEWRASTSG